MKSTSMFLLAALSCAPGAWANPGTNNPGGQAAVGRSPFALPTEPAVSGQHSGQSASPFALPESAASAGDIEALPPPGSSPFALPDDSSEAGQPTSAPEDNQATASPFLLPAMKSTPVEAQVPPERPVAEIEQQASIEALQTLGAEALREKGTALAREGRYDEARQALALSLQKEPESVTTLNNLGLVMRKLGRLDDSLQAYTLAIQVDARYALTYKNLGILLEHQQDNALAVEAYRQYLELAPDARDAADVRARADWLEKQCRRCAVDDRDRIP